MHCTIKIEKEKYSEKRKTEKKKKHKDDLWMRYAQLLSDGDVKKEAVMYS